MHMSCSQSVKSPGQALLLLSYEKNSDLWGFVGLKHVDWNADIAKLCSIQVRSHGTCRRAEVDLEMEPLVIINLCLVFP